jgi:enamine deaminase RidA (YjgF/YER057c/UK114 family)
VSGGVRCVSRAGEIGAARYRSFLPIAHTGAFVVNGASTPAHSREYIKAERPQQRAYSQAVITEGGKTVWLAGQMATVDDAGNSLAND